MEEFYPSEIARLVLGYLKEVECHNAWKTFVEESFDLREYYNLYKEGKVYTTNVNGKSLVDTLRDYCSFKSNADSSRSQNNCANNAFQNEEVETPQKVTENTRVVHQMVQTSSSTPACQTPKRKSKCRVTQLNFDRETQCMDESLPNDAASVDELSCRNSAPNSPFNTNCIITDNTVPKSVMTTSVQLCNTSTQTDLNFDYKNQNSSSIGIQTENVCLCLHGLSKNPQESFQTSTKQTSCSISDANEVDVHISSASSPELSRPAGYSEQNNHDSGTTNVCDKVEESFPSSNNESLSEISSCDKCESETVLTNVMSQSSVLEKLDDKANHREEIFPKKVGNSPVSNHIYQTTTAAVDILENMDVTEENAAKDNLTSSTKDDTFEKNSCDSNKKTANISSVGYNEKNTVLSENSTDIQNKSITSEPGDHLNVNKGATELFKEASNPLDGNKVPGHENLSGNASSFQLNFDNQEITKSPCSDSQLNNCNVSTTSSSKLEEFNNENMTSNNLTTNSEKFQDSNSEYISSGLEKNQSDLEFVKCNIPSDLTNADKISADLPGNVKAQKGSEYSSLTKDENKANDKSLSEISLEKSKTDTVSEKDFPSGDTNKEGNNIDVKNKSQVKNINSDVCRLSDNNNSNAVSEMDKSDKISINSQLSSTVVPPLIFNKSSSCFLISSSSIPYQSIPSGTFIQNNGQYFMILPVPPVPTNPTVPVNSVTNPVILSSGTVLTSTNNLSMVNNEKPTTASSNSDKIYSTVNTPLKQDIDASSAMQLHSKNSDQIPSIVNTPSKQNVVAPSPIRSSSESDKNKGKPTAYLITSSPMHNKDALSVIETPSKQNKEKPMAHLITSSPMHNKVLTSEIQTPFKKRLKEQSESTACVTLDPESSASSKTSKKKVKKSKKKKKSQKDSKEFRIPNKKKSSKAKKQNKQNLDIKVISSELPSLLSVENASLTENLDHHSILSSFKRNNSKELKIPNKKKSSKAKKQNLDKKVISHGLPSSLSVENASLTENLDHHSILSSFKSPSHSNLSAVFEETPELIDKDGIEKECRVLKVVVSDVLKSSHVRCLDFNAASTSDKSENEDKELCRENRSQFELQTGEISYKSSEVDCSLIDKNIENSKNVTSSCRNQKINTSVKEINTTESILANETDNFEIDKNLSPLSASCSAVSNTEEFNFECINSTDTIVKEITTALVNCLEDVPDSIEVVVLSDSEEINKEEDTVNSQCLATDIDDLLVCQEINQKNLNAGLGSANEPEKIKNRVTSKSTINNAADCENDQDVIDMDCRKLPEALDSDNIEQNNETFHHQEVKNIASRNYKKDEQNLADNVSITKVGDDNFELCTAASVDFNSEKDDLDSSRSLMINTSPINEEENAEIVENSLILSDSESVENDSSSNSLCELNHYSNGNSEELSPLSNNTVVNVSLHDETQNMPSNINEKIDSSGIHLSPKNHLVSTNSPFFKQKLNVNQIVKSSAHDEKHFQLNKCSEKKANLHLPQGIIDSVKYFNSQSKMRKHANVKNLSKGGLNSVDKSSVRSNISTTFNPTSNSLQVIEADNCKSVVPCKILNSIVSIETAETENLNSSKIKCVKASSVNNNLINDIPHDDRKKATLSSNKKTKQFLSGLHYMKNFATDIDSSQLYCSKINYSSRTPCKIRIRHHSYDSSVSQGKAEALSSSHMITSRNSKSLENITNIKLDVQTDIHRKHSSIQSVYSHACELKTSLNQHEITHSSSLKQDTVSKKSVQRTSDDDNHPEIVLHEGNSQLSTKVQQTDSHKFAAKRYLLDEDSHSDEDSALMKDKKAIADKFSNKRILLEKDSPTFQQTGKYFTKNCTLKNDAQFRVRTRKTPKSNVKIINTRLEVKNQTNTDYESSKSILGTKEPIQSAEKQIINDFNQTQSDEVSNITPEKNETQAIYETAGLVNDKGIPRRSVCYKRKSSDSLPSEECSVVSSDDKQMLKEKVSNISPEKDKMQTNSETACLDNMDLPCRSVHYKRKSSDSFSSQECSAVTCSDDRLSLKKNHYLDNNQVYEKDSNSTKRPKLDNTSSSPKKDHLNDTLEENTTTLTSSAVSVESQFIANEYPISKSIVENIKRDVMKDSPVRFVSYKKKTAHKTALMKRLEEDPNIPPGVKIPSKWNTSKIINYSDAIGHSLCDNLYSKKNVVQNKKRRSRPTLKISSIQSPSKEVLSDKKNLSSKLSTKLSSLNCRSEEPTERIVCHLVPKIKNQQKSKKTVKKSRKLDSQENIKLGCKQTVLQKTKKKSVATKSAELMKVQSHVCDSNVSAQVNPKNTSVMNHCETTQDIVEADIGRSDENGSELANAIASVERELVHLSSDSAPESSEAAMDDEMIAMQNSDAISDNCEPEGNQQASLECVSEQSKLAMLLEKIKSMGVDKVLERIYTLEEEK